MSISLDDQEYCQCPRPRRAGRYGDWASNPLCFARYIVDRREELGMSAAEAAERAGLELCQWCALEGGWIPGTIATVRVIAGALLVEWQSLQMLAFLCEWGQKKHRC